MQTNGRLAQKAATRRRLLDAAAATFMAGSVTTTSLDTVARAAGVSKATLLFHFGSRIDLLEAVAFDLYVGAADTVWRPRQPGLRAFLTGYFAAQRRPESRLVWEIGDALTADDRPVLDAAYRHFTDHIANLLEEDGHDVDEARVLTGIVTPAVLQMGRRVTFGRATDDELSRFKADLDRLLVRLRQAVPAPS